MGIGFFRFGAVVLAGLALAGAAKAQSSEPVCTPGYIRFIGYSVPNIPHAAFSATVKNSFEQTLPDGNHVRGFTRVQQARDDAGRTMIQRPMQMPGSCRLDENGVPRLDLTVTVFGPSTETTLHWQTGPTAGKVVEAYHAHVVSPPGATTPPRAPLATPQLAAGKQAAVQSVAKNAISTEDLGTRNIAGLEAHGWRSTRTIAAGAEGNELPVVTTHENWRSDELQLTLMAVDDDPRAGRTTMEVEELSRTEPDPSVFAPPEGYTIEDSTRPATTP
jgi:hypothetical protein